MSEVHKIVWNATGKTTIDNNLSSFIDTSGSGVRAFSATSGFQWLFQELTTDEANDLDTYVDDTNIYDGSLSGGGIPIP
ncbi:hypothetical protein LCGC14_0370600 [marine sediment metagenome]|uniref:Uncharacterized protein n=1 Tax=marine sediment metagenome TaxID=412755 RepID=A0A0F9TB42_9ZZZZ|nr:hypothetical protein [Maribacter sp.]HDZ04894.1 hypothetical protein [Maribacter sp.]